MDLSVIVVTYNSRAFISACLESVNAALGRLSAAVVVVDNCSSGGKVLDPGGTLQRSVRSFPSYGAVFGARYSIFTKLWPENPFSSKYLRSDLLYDTPEPVDWISGACLLHRRAVSDALEGPDEGF